MPASRITFAIGDLVTEIKRLLPRDADPVMEIHLDEATFGATVGEIQNHYGEELKADAKYPGVGVMFGGMRIVMIPKARPVGRPMAHEPGPGDA